MTLKRWCQKAASGQKEKYTNLKEWVEFVQNEMAGNGQMQRYQWLYHKTQ